MYRISFHLVSIVLGLCWAANLPNVPEHTNQTTRLGRRGRVMSRVGVTLCRDFPGLTRAQSSTCLKHPVETAVALQGLKMAVVECQFQFRWNRWNCSSLRGLKNRNPHSAPLLKKGYRESAFAYAISAAGVMQAVSRACGLGILPNCGCGEEQILDLHTLPDEKQMPEIEMNEEDNETSRRKRHEKLSRRARSQWQWGGCAHNLRFGMQFSELFLDAREVRGADLQSKVNLHNNRAGRMSVMANSLHRCKCHGLSGSCEIRTCWRSAPEFRRVGDTLKAQFRSAILVGQGNLGRKGVSEDLEEAEETDNSVHEIVPESLHLTANLKTKEGKGRKRRRRRKRGRGNFWRSTRRSPDNKDLLYFQKSPNFCETSIDFPGTGGRRCNKNSSGNDGCASMCCGRGYNLIRVRKTEKCFCRFEWCCQVMCRNCTVEEWLTVCK